MKPTIILFTITIFLSACTNNSGGNHVMTLESKYDTVTISNQTDDSIRIVTYKYSNERNNSSITIFDKRSSALGKLKNHMYDGRFYVLDTNNIILAIEYYTNNQRVYVHNISDKYISSKDVRLIRRTNIDFIKPPLLEYKEIDTNRARIKIIGINYPLILSRITTSEPNSFDGSSFDRNLTEESEEAIIKIKERPVKLYFDYGDSGQNVIKSYVWKSTDKDFIFKEVNK